MHLHLYAESELHATMDAPSNRASNCEAADEDDGTIVSDTELSDLSDSSFPKETCTNKLSLSDGADQPKDPPESHSHEFVRISSQDEPDTSYLLKETCSNKLSLSDRADQPTNVPESHSPEFGWISSNDKPDPSQKQPTPCQKRPHIDDWSDSECSISKFQRGSRQEYTFDDKKAIVDYISKTNSYNKVKGKKLWQTMADTKVCPGRTWQSLKEHYRKKIIPNISIFYLPKNIENLFLAPFPQYRQKKHVHFEDDNLKRSEKEFKESDGNTDARHVVDPPQLCDSADYSDIELSDLSLKKEESEIQPPEMSSPGTPDMANEWLSTCDKKESSEYFTEEVPEGSQNKFNDIYSEEILKLIGNSDPVDRPSDSFSEIDIPNNGPVIASETPELLSSEVPTGNEGSAHALETEITQVTNTPPGREERPVDEQSGLECILGLPSYYDGVPKLLVSDVPAVSDIPAEEMIEANSTVIEKPLVAEGHLTAEEEGLSDESFDKEIICGIPSIDEEALILPIRKRTCLNPQPCTPQITEQTTIASATTAANNTTTTTTTITTSEAEPLTPSKWPVMKIVQKSPPNSTVRISVRKLVSVPSEEFLYRARRREYTFDDKKAIVNYISKTDSYHRVKGRKFWQSMVDHQVCPGRTWQSLKEHYIKQIIPNICIFRLPEEEEKKFLAPFV
ncbi:uncharacterized protein [Anabrus simplex]|uniref:uncharacterized protein isoform X2 n=1 Tax=Anabrus simplex TaxID=316456 RepID=UPI0035A2D425